MSQWYYKTDADSAKIGPVSTEQLRRLIRQGKLSQGSMLLQHAGSEHWIAASRITEELFLSYEERSLRLLRSIRGMCVLILVILLVPIILGGLALLFGGLGGL